MYITNIFFPTLVPLDSPVDQNGVNFNIIWLGTCSLHFICCEGVIKNQKLWKALCMLCMINAESILSCTYPKVNKNTHTEKYTYSKLTLTLKNTPIQNLMQYSDFVLIHNVIKYNYRSKIFYFLKTC